MRLLSINSVGEGENRTTVFTEGSYSFLYLAVDQEGNEDTCIVDLTVRGQYLFVCLCIVCLFIGLDRYNSTVLERPPLGYTCRSKCS